MTTIPQRYRRTDRQLAMVILRSATVRAVKKIKTIKLITVFFVQNTHYVVTFIKFRSLFNNSIVVPFVSQIG